jgi:hypothetical protein
MKQFISVIFLVFLINININAQTIVKDDNKINQWKSIEFMQWKFTPKWYYYGLFDGGLLGFHQNYIDNYNNNIKQYTPAIASVVLQRMETEKQEEDTEEVYKQELAKFTDKEIDYAYSLSSSRRNELKEEFLLYYNKYAQNNSFMPDGEKNCKTLLFEYERILANVKIIHESHMSNAKKREAYIECEQELVGLVALVNRLSNLNNILELSNKLKL